MKARAKEGRELPNDLGAETSVIGSLLIENAGFDSISSQLEPSQCFRDAHRKILTVIYDLLGAGKPADLRTVATELKRRKLPSGEHWLEDVGGPAYLASLVDGVPRSTNIRYYAEIVREKAALRRLVTVGAKITERAYANDADAKDVLSGAEIALADVATMAKVASGAVSVESCMPAMNVQMAARIERKGQLAGISSGLPELDLYTHGWQRRSMYVFAAETSFGKSVMGLQAAIALATAGERVIYYSLEMRKEKLIERGWSMLSGIPMTQIMWGNINTADEFRRLADAQERLAALPLEINDTRSTSIMDITAECRQVKADRGLGGVVVDYFQRMDVPEGDNRVQKLGEISRRFFDLVGNLDLTGFMLSQLTIDPREANQEPNLEHLKDCKQLGHDCDFCLMLSPHKRAEIRGETPVVTMKGLIRKQRDGRLGRVWLDFERDYVRFVAGQEPRPEPKAEKKKAEPVTEAIRY